MTRHCDQPERGSIRVATAMIVTAVLGLAVVGFVQARAGSSSPDLVVTRVSVPLDELPDYQQEIFADGRVTFQEYEQAAVDTVTCIRSRGVDADDPVLEEDQTFSFIVAVPEDGDESRVDSIVSACMDEYYSVVQLAWADEIHDPASEDEFNSILLTCLRNGGVEADEESLPSVLDAHPDLFDRCSTEAAEQIAG